MLTRWGVATLIIALAAFALGAFIGAGWCWVR
jgi:hypothetical protein